jgi:two-component system chemotaxis sensor kinase CheA
MSPVRDRIFADGSARDEAAADGDTKREHQALLMFGVAGDSTMAVPLAMVSRLEEFPKSRVEHAGGHPVIQYRGKILPLVDLAARLGFAPSATAGGDGVVRVIVHTDAGRSVGFVVDDILDIVETDVALQEGTSRPGVLGAAIVQGRVTEMLDVQALLMDHDRHLLGGKAA